MQGAPHATQPETTSAAGTPVVEVAGLSKSFQDPRYPAVDRLDLTLQEGETLALLGPSGCGKTTLLRLLAGFETPDRGTIRIQGDTVVGPSTFVPPEQRKIGFVFQDYALFPHLNVAANVAFGLRGWSAERRNERVREVLDLVGLNVFARRYPGQLSGGQQQRVALARALAPQPAVILLDEPFSNLDAALRAGTRTEVRRILARTNATTLLVTHDQEEAMTFADRIAVMRSGRLEQAGPPERTYLEPKTAFVAGFLGDTNLLRGEAHGDAAATDLGTVSLTRPAEGVLMVSVRPEDLRLGSQGETGLPVVITERRFHGHDMLFQCRTVAPDGTATGDTWTVRTGPGRTFYPGDFASLTVKGRAVPLDQGDTP